MRKFLILFTLFCGFAFSGLGQILEPVTWESTIVKTDDTDYVLIFKGEIDENWAIYSQTLSGDEGPIPTTVNATSENYQFNGDGVECGNVAEKFDPIFEMKIKKFFDQAIIVKPITIDSDNGKITGYLNFMACDDKQCLAPTDYDFSFDLAEAQLVEDYSEEEACRASYFSAEFVDPQKKNDSEFLSPTSWDYDIEKVKDGTYKLNFNVEFQEGWHTYSVQTKPDDGPVPTYFEFDEGEHFKTLGGVTEFSGEKETKMDPFFEAELTTLGGKSKFTQLIQVSDPTKDITGFYEFQTCDAKQCLPPAYEEFVVNISRDQFTLKSELEENNAELALQDQEGSDVFNKEFDFSDSEFNCEEATVSRNVDEQSSFWWIFFAGFLGGLLALLTPCVFPMIPLTVSYFTKSKKSGLSNALIYGISIIVIYLGLGLLITAIAGPEALNQLSTNAWFNIFFFLLFIVFAFSFFGYFELTLPSSWVNRSDKAADRGGLIGTFFMAFTLALVSFSCTGPIIGTLLVETATGNGPQIFGYLPIGPLVGMFGFSLALALPFALFAAFPSWLNSLPKSGSWMNSVKVTLGFVEIALAFKFLSVADLTMGWKILPYELFVAVWLLCAIGLALYYFGKLKFPHDSPLKKLSVGRIGMGIVATLIGIYILSGFRYDESIKSFVTPPVLSGLAPPAGHSYIHPNDCPLNLNCFKDFEKGLAYAREEDKPILLDFTGYGCVNCRKMEDQVWSEDDIFKIINDEYVLISLYTDDRKSLEETYVSRFDGKVKHNVGQKWSDFEAIHFNRNTQPYYVLVSNERKVLNQPRAYTPDDRIYKAWLECGLERNALQKNKFEF